MAVEPRNGAVRSIGMRNLMAPRHVGSVIIVLACPLR